MKQVNFTHPGGFPLEQETLERLQTAYRHELFEALKSHLSIDPAYDYIVSPPKNGKEGWAIIHPKNVQGVKTREGILYPIQPDAPTGFLKTTRTGTNLTYGTGESQTAYFDYDAQYISPEDYANRPGSTLITDALAIHYYDLNNPAFIVIKDIQAIETILDAIDVKIKAIQTNIGKIETDISTNYLPLNGSKAMKGDLDLGSYQLSKLDIKATPTANVRVTDFRLGSNLGRALVNDSTKLTLNAASDWKNTSIGGNLYLDDLNTSSEDFTSLKSSANSLLLIDNASQVMKSNNLLNSLLDRISELEKKPATAIPKGMISIWGKPAPFPDGWEEYVPLRGRMPVGIDIRQTEFNTLEKTGGAKSSNVSVPVPVDGYTRGENTSQGTSGRLIISTGQRESGENLESIEKVLDSPNIDFSVSIINPYKVVHFIEYTGRSLVTTALTTPPNLIAEKVGATFADLSWTPTYGDAGITNYLVYKNDILFATINNVPFFTVNGLSRSSSYDFCVRAQDAAGNISGASNTIRVKTKLF